MAISGKYGKLDIPGIGRDEPVFVLRGQDRLAETAIDLYQALARSHGAPVEAGVRKEIERFHDWQGIRKLPD